jgi:hypothetical protein
MRRLLVITVFDGDIAETRDPDAPVRTELALERFPDALLDFQTRFTVAVELCDENQYLAFGRWRDRWIGGLEVIARATEHERKPSPVTDRYVSRSDHRVPVVD